MSQGEYVTPELIEQVYLQSPLINQIFVDGSSLYPNPVALIVPDGESLCEALNDLRRNALDGNVLRKNSIRNNENVYSDKFYLNGQYVSLSELCNNSEAEQLILKDIIQLNKSSGLRRFEQVR